MADRRKCPECGVSVKLENLAAHYERQHPRATPPERLMDESAEATRAVRRERRPEAPLRLTGGGKAIILVVAVVLAIALVVVIVNPFRPHGPQVGDPAPNFTVPNADPAQGPLTLSSYQGSVTVLELMDVDCRVCQQEAPVITAVYQNYSGRGVRFLSVSLIDWVAPADTTATIASFKSTYGANWPFGMDTDRVVRSAYFPGSAGFGTPTTYVLSRTGVISAILQGHQAGGYGDYANALDAALRA